MKKILTVTFLLAFSFSAFCQTNYTGIQYSIGFGTGDMHDYIGPASFRGFTADYRYLPQPSIGVGFSTGWNIFYEELPDDTYDYRNVTFSGKQWRYSNHFPVLGVLDYFVMPEGKVSGFAGIGIGAMYSVRDLDMGVFSFQRNAWQFAMKPELGALVKLAKGFNFTLSASFLNGFKSGELPTQGFFTINAGFSLIQ